jgi:glycyl-tRNA synthetase
VLISVMKKHQRYFPVEKAGGQLLPYFIAVRNGDNLHLDLVREGNEHVIRARFADADFFVREDAKLKLEDFRPRLSTLTFQKKLGSMLDKSERVEKLTAEVARWLKLDEAETRTALRAAHLCKADLATQMVVEMTSLQGTMGREYALRSGETPEVAQAIQEHYGLPESRPGMAVGIADRLDSLAGLFAAGLAPTGSADPFGLRRAALGLTQICTTRQISIDLRAALAAACAAQVAEVQPAEAQLDSLMAFVAGRLRGQLLDLGYRYDVVDAVLAEQAANPYQAAVSVRQLSEWIKRDDWSQILPAYARCVRITRDQKQVYAVTADRLGEPAEKGLYAAYQAAAGQPMASVDEFLNRLLPMIPAISKFFEDVLVMADDPGVRENRLGLLQRIGAMAKGLADFSKLEGF